MFNLDWNPLDAIMYIPSKVAEGIGYVNRAASTGSWEPWKVEQQQRDDLAARQAREEQAKKEAGWAARKKLQADLDAGTIKSDGFYATDPQANIRSNRTMEAPSWSADMADPGNRGFTPIPGWTPEKPKNSAAAAPPITPSNRINDAGEAMRTAGDELGKLMEAYRTKLDSSWNAINNMKNPWDTNGDAFKMVLADARNRVASTMGQGQAGMTSMLANAGQLGGTKADMMRAGAERAGRKAMSQTEGALYADALRNSSNFEMQKQQTLASLLGQGFNNGMQGTQLLSGLTEKAFTLPVSLDTAKAQGNITQSQAAETAATSRLNIEKANKELGRLGLVDEAQRKMLEAGILEGRVKIEEGKIKVEDATWWASLPGPLRTTLDAAAKMGKTFIEGFSEGLGKNIAGGGKG